MAIGQGDPRSHRQGCPSHWGKVCVPDIHVNNKADNNPSSTQGIGFHTANQLAAHGAKVYIGARSSEKAEAAIQAIRSSNPSIAVNKLESFIADLGDLKAVQAAAQDLLSKEDRLDILVHNAAV